MKADDTKSVTQATSKRTWTRPTVKYVGDIGDVLQGGGGKLTPSPADPGEVRKPSGAGG